MRKLVVLSVVLMLALASNVMAEAKKADMGSVGSCMRQCVQSVNPSTKDVYSTEISVDEFTLDCVNYCNPNLKEGYCSPETDDCCNVMYQDVDRDCITEPEVIVGQFQVCNPDLIEKGTEACIEGMECMPLYGDYRCQDPTLKPKGSGCRTNGDCMSGVCSFGVWCYTKIDGEYTSCNVSEGEYSPPPPPTSLGVCVEPSESSLGMNTSCSRAVERAGYSMCSRRLVLTCKYNIYYDKYL